MYKWKPCDAVSIVRKWGPSTRTVLAILGDPDKEKDLRRYADCAAIDICNDPPRVPLRDIEQLPSGRGSTLLFICPIRAKASPDYSDSRVIIPTTHLLEIFDSRCQGLSAQSRLRLHEVFSMRPTAKGVAGWLHKKNMHLQMMAMVRNHYEIFNGCTKLHMCSATGVLVGTASALRAATCNRLSSIYWFPSFMSFPGIDSILINGNNIYALQATIADTYDKPSNGLKKVWQTIGPEVAQHFTWHFVMVTDNKPLADKYAKDFGTQLCDVTLGVHPYVRVSMWVSVLKSGVQPLA